MNQQEQSPQMSAVKLSWSLSFLCQNIYIVVHIKYHLLTESEVITGKSQTEALIYLCNDQTDEVNKLFIIWPF